MEQSKPVSQDLFLQREILIAACHVSFICSGYYFSKDLKQVQNIIALCHIPFYI